MRREFEDDEDIFIRDLDADELLGRDYDDGDLFERDLDNEEFFGREYDLLDERDTFDNEDLFERDIEAELEELFGREYYDLLDEQYYWIIVVDWL